MELDVADQQTEADSTAPADNPDGVPEIPGNDHISAVIVLAGKQHFIRVGYDVEILVSDADKYLKDKTVEVPRLVMAFLQSDDSKSPSTIRFGNPYLEGATALLKYKSSRKNKGLSFKKRRRKSSSKTTRGYKNYSIRFSVEELSIPEIGREQIDRSIVIDSAVEAD